MRSVPRISSAVPLFIAMILGLLSASSARADESWGETGWALTGFGGVLTTNKSSDIWLHGDFGLDDDFEQGVVKHFGGQSNWEFDSVLLVRWNTFPWDSFIDTSLAVGDGVSFATDTPDLEVARYGLNKANPILNFVLAEFTFALP